MFGGILQGVAEPWAAVVARPSCGGHVTKVTARRRDAAAHPDSPSGTFKKGGKQFHLVLSDFILPLLSLQPAPPSQGLRGEPAGISPCVEVRNTLRCLPASLRDCTEGSSMCTQGSGAVCSSVLGAPGGCSALRTATSPTWTWGSAGSAVPGAGLRRHAFCGCCTALRGKRGREGIQQRQRLLAFVGSLRDRLWDHCDHL